MQEPKTNLKMKCNMYIWRKQESEIQCNDNKNMPMDARENNLA